jgi:hypothetical protein
MEALLKMADVTISSIQDLVAFSNGDYGRGTSSAYLDVVLTADLDFNDLKEYDTPYNWAGCTGTWYINFDGQGHKIDNIFYSGNGKWGFFDDVYGGSTIKNLKLTNLYVTGSHIGCVARYTRGVTIENCSVSGQVISVTSSALGGICGGANGTLIVRGCSFSGVIQNTGGGVTAGVLPQDGRLQCFGTLIVADITGRDWMGGFSLDNQMLVDCEFRGTLQGPSGKVTSLAGSNSDSTNCIAAIKSFSGNWYSHGNLYNCYFDSTLAAAGGFSLPGTGATTAELQSTQWLREHNFAI